MKAVIEIPKGDDRRRHIKYDKTGFVDLGPIKDVIPVNEGVMPVDYGYVPGTMNEKEGDEIDILIISDKKFKVGQEIEVEPIALIMLDNGDDKVIAVDETKKSIKGWSDIPEQLKNLIKNFFGYKNKIIAIEDEEKAKQYVRSNHT
jgi:inorganic pyrophosphatase